MFLQQSEHVLPQVTDVVLFEVPVGAYTPGCAAKKKKKRSTRFTLYLAHLSLAGPSEWLIQVAVSLAFFVQFWFMLFTVIRPRYDFTNICFERSHC